MRLPSYAARRCSETSTPSYLHSPIVDTFICSDLPFAVVPVLEGQVLGRPDSAGEDRLHFC